MYRWAFEALFAMYSILLLFWVTICDKSSLGDLQRGKWLSTRTKAILIGSNILMLIISTIFGGMVDLDSTQAVGIGAMNIIICKLSIYYNSLFVIHLLLLLLSYFYYPFDHLFISIGIILLVLFVFYVFQGIKLYKVLSKSSPSSNQVRSILSSIYILINVSLNE